MYNAHFLILSIKCVFMSLLMRIVWSLNNLVNKFVWSLNARYFHFHFIMPVMPDKAAFVSAELLCVQRYRETAILPLQKRHLVAKNEFAFSFRPTRKDQQVGGNMLMFHVDFNMKQFGICFKNDSFQWFRVDSFFWETTLYTVHFQI